MGGEGVVDGEEGSSEKCLKWSGGGVIKRSFQKHLKTGVGKDESCSSEGGGFEGATTPVPPPRKILIIHSPSRCNSHATTGNWTINDAWGAGIKAVQTDSTKTNTHVLDA